MTLLSYIFTIVLYLVLYCTVLYCTVLYKVYTTTQRNKKKCAESIKLVYFCVIHLPSFGSTANTILTRDGTAEPVWRDQILRRERGQGNIHFPCSVDHEQDWQHYPVDPYSCYMW